MTREEAIERYGGIRYTVACFTGSKKDCDAVDMAFSALRPISREQVEKVFGGKWEDMREAYNDVPKRRCSRCKSVFIGLDTPFCDACGAPMTDEAVDIRLKELEALKDG